MFQNAAELLGILTQIEKRDVVFIDEIHRLSRVVEEHLYPAMEEFRCELVVDKGPHARHYSITIEPFTLVGATTRAGMITPPMRSRFGVVARLDFYRAEDLVRIVKRSAELLDIEIDDEGTIEIAQALPGNAAHRQPAPAPRPRLRPDQGEGETSTARSPITRSGCSRSTRRG